MMIVKKITLSISLLMIAWIICVFSRVGVMDSESWEEVYYDRILIFVDDDNEWASYIFLADITLDGIPELIVKDNALLPTGVVYSYTSSDDVVEIMSSCPYHYSLYKKDGNLKWISISEIHNAGYAEGEVSILIKELKEQKTKHIKIIECVLFTNYDICKMRAIFSVI